jgi:hypothetical protein
MEKKIKCHLCNGTAVLKFEDLKLDEGRIIIKDSPYYECTKCKEQFSSSEQMQELSDQINSKFVFKRPIINAGRSLAITLPADLIQHYNLKKGKKIKLIPENKKEILLTIE